MCFILFQDAPAVMENLGIAGFTFVISRTVCLKLQKDFILFCLPMHPNTPSIQPSKYSTHQYKYLIHPIHPSIHPNTLSIHPPIQILYPFIHSSIHSSKYSTHQYKYLIHPSINPNTLSSSIHPNTPSIHSSIQILVRLSVQILTGTFKYEDVFAFLETILQ